MKNNTYEHILVAIRERILSRSIFPGSRIVEEDLAKQFGVSRTTIRSIINSLQHEGFVKIVPNKGTFVIQPTYEEILNVYHTRRFLELGAAALAVENVNDEAIARMEENYAEQLKLKERFSIIEYAELNRAFHWELALASENEYYMKYLNEIYNVVHIFMIFFDNAKDNTRSLESHAMMLEGMRNRDLKKLQEAIIFDNSNGMSDLNFSYGYGV